MRHNGYHTKELHGSFVWYQDYICQHIYDNKYCQNFLLLDIFYIFHMFDPIFYLILFNPRLVPKIQFSRQKKTSTST